MCFLKLQSKQSLSEIGMILLSSITPYVNKNQTPSELKKGGKVITSNVLLDTVSYLSMRATSIFNENMLFLLFLNHIFYFLFCTNSEAIVIEDCHHDNCKRTLFNLEKESMWLSICPKFFNT
jgi:hypothetical protein